MYSATDFGQMIANRTRMAAYEQAIKDVVFPGAVVADIGAGTGIFSLLACQAGAKTVYSIEPADSIAIARATAASNGLQDRIVFHERLSTDVVLPEKVDVVISDLRGVLPFFLGNISSVIDARDRLLRPSGAIVAIRDSLWATVSESPTHHRYLAGPWTETPGGVDLSIGQRYTLNTWEKSQTQDLRPLGEHVKFFTLDYGSVSSPDLTARFSIPVTESGVAHGLTVWFDTEVGPSSGLSNAPGQRDSFYGSAFFPWLRPVELDPGDRIQVEISARLTGEDYLWSWNSSISGPAAVQPKALFRQSTFFGNALTLASIRRRASDYKPSLSRSAALDAFILAQVDGVRTLADIAQNVMAAFPDSFPTTTAALTRVADLLQRYA